MFDEASTYFIMLRLKKGKTIDLTITDKLLKLDWWNLRYKKKLVTLSVDPTHYTSFEK